LQIQVGGIQFAQIQASQVAGSQIADLSRATPFIEFLYLLFPQKAIKWIVVV